MPLLEKGLIISNKQTGTNLWEMEFIAPGIAAECQPGQFVHVRSEVNQEPLLRRPLSLYDVDNNLGSITLLYKVVGRGTEILTRFENKQYLDVMGPLGKGFTLPDASQKVLLVGGGVGIAPLVYLCRKLRENENEVTVLYGTANRRELTGIERLRNLDICFMPATLDGSAGYKGLVTDLLMERVNPDSIDRIYTCGPEPMMAAVARYAFQHGIPGEVSLEEYMACGVGACLGCARKLKSSDDRYAKICKDGPVFPMDTVELEDWRME